MRTLIFLIVLLMLPVVVSAAGFFQSVGDLPLMQGLREVPEAALLYDKPEGRIVELVARGRVGEKAVREFYARTLPQLGWTPGAGHFVRDGEVLRIVAQKENGELVVYLSINPQ